MSKTKNGILSLLIVIISLVFLSPIYIVIVNSFKTRAELYENVLSLPSTFSFEYYITAIKKMNFLVALGNSLYVTIVTVIFVIVLASMTAWMLVRRDNVMSKIIFFLFVATMLIPFQTLMMPLMQVMDWIRTHLHLPVLNTHGGLIFMNIGFHAGMAVFLYHGFIKSIPVALEEAAVLDGCSTLGVFWKIVFPLLKSISVTVAILDVIASWNDYLLPSLVLSEKGLRTIQLSTFYFFGEFTIVWNQAMAGLTLTIIPIVIFYAIAQKYIIKGIAAGAVK
ncbi:carbohydrate ABC transporter permease [Paenibacillus taichungensis]|uniref:carbohydrate ABC transporter permease n=1 Tax=Paenibacillus TaxID=44249 RepID=UPI00096D4AC3|nr:MULTISPECIES: carbohydrate ABC transporter permease [Paenibacillus]MEC0111070.1 carbohydrate ABC transporter permease [Paenibacillus taichungensis]MEC0196915.1 carbohydrate ABC transporter permease [Paenibacillus taichungensis]OME83735.1 sugar ABC transporter permease [Paenibacillus pabuli]PIH55882.1 carbohydrate ABC transporter permease [Paenibacillus sp. LK1]